MKKVQADNITIGFIALGCPKNTVDSESMLGKLCDFGFALSNNPENADIIIINTCSFIAPARKEAFEQIHNAVKLKEKGQVQRVIVTGCLAEMLDEQIRLELNGVDAVVGLTSRDQIADIVVKTMATDKPMEYFGGDKDNFVSNDKGRVLISGGHYAYLRISEGCNRRCSFCTIPRIRGKFRSKSMRSIISEAHELARSGIKELILIAQDSNYYGIDRGQKEGLAELLTELNKIKGFKWIRVMYLYPAGVSSHLIETFAKCEKVLPYVDMPVQHINNDILKSMKRVDTRENTIELISNLRKAMPNVVLRTTLITGYPGETEQQHNELTEFVKNTEFDALGCFTFYPEANTAAADLENQLSEDIKQKRFDEIMGIQQKIAFAKNKKMIGSELEVIIDDFDQDGNAIGRYYGQAPEIDSICIVTNCKAQSGEFIKVKIIDFDAYDLIAEQI